MHRNVAREEKREKKKEEKQLPIAVVKSKQLFETFGLLGSTYG